MSLNPENAESIPRKLIGMYSATELKLLGMMADAVSKGIDTPEWAAQQPAEMLRFRNQAQQLANGLTAAAPSVVGEAVQAAAKFGRDAVDADIDLAGHLAAKSWRPAGLQANLTVGKTLEQRALEDGVGALARVNQALPGAASNLYQQVTTRVNATPVSSDLTRRQAVQQALDVLTARGITGFKDNAGRNWSLSTYVEMKSRTLVNNTLRESHEQQALARGHDLLVVSSHANPAPVCQPYEGQVLSIGQNAKEGSTIRPNATGGDPVRVKVKATLSDARSKGLFHPNCKHATSIYLPGASRTFTTEPNEDGYKATQQQRAMERAIRDTKRRQAVAIEPSVKKRLNATLRSQQTALKQHVEANDLKRRSLRERPDLGYRINPPDALDSVTDVPTTPKPTAEPKRAVAVDSYKANASTTKKLQAELAGLDDGGNGDLRRIIKTNPQGTNYLVARDNTGAPIGAMQYTPQKRSAGSPREVNIHQLRSTTKGVGSGRALITEAARIARDLDKTGKDGYELKVYGVIDTATTFYESTGAVVDKATKIGHWDRNAIDRLLDPVAAPTPDVEGWLAAEKKFVDGQLADTKAWLAAESKYKSTVTEWLKAEQTYRRSGPARTLTEDEGRDYGSNVWFDYADTLSDSERSAVRFYTGNGYEDINEPLRDLTLPVDTKLGNKIALIDAAIESAPRVPEKIIVGRTIAEKVFGITARDGYTLEASNWQARLDQAVALIGKPLRDDGFMSTALQSEEFRIEYHEAKLLIEVPEGTKGLYVSSHPNIGTSPDPRALASYGPEENELLLSRGVEYEFVDADMNPSNGDLTITMRITGQSPKKVEVTDG